MGACRPDTELDDRVWTHTPEGEKAQDAERRAITLIADLERVVAHGVKPERNFVMERCATYPLTRTEEVWADRRATRRTAAASSSDADLTTVTVAPNAGSPAIRDGADMPI